MNRLGREQSPYLLQHKDNPIDWFPWGPEAFAVSQNENKPIFLSIGYSTCHWCHVMAHESFEDQEVAEALNKSFVSIKLDREERPDIDNLYMSTVQTLTGGGGWPLSVWLTPQGKPFFAGTYFPKFRFLQLLRRIEQIWQTEAEKLEQDAEKLVQAVQQATHLAAEPSQEADYEEFLQTYISHFQHHYDEENGGFGQAPKFPQSMNLMAMMRQDRVTGLYQAEAMVTGTLNAMIRGGMYDHLQGGFHRYSVDEKWLVPHFEKMLYDQAWITRALLEATQIYDQSESREEFLRAVRETLDYVLREMRSSKGGFFCAQDADSLAPEGQLEEGYFCTYSHRELEENLTDEEMEVLQKAYGLTRNGNFEGRTILHLQEGFDRTVLEKPEARTAFAKLREIRRARPQPHLDDKVLAGWNGWMISTLCLAARVLREPSYLKAAQEAGRFIRSNMWRNGTLERRWRGGESAIAGTAEDYAGVVSACIALYESDFDRAWMEWALELQKVLDRDFWDEEQGGYYTSDGRDSLLILRGKEDYDGVHPSANSLSAHNLLKIFDWTGEIRYRQRAEGIFQLLFSRARSFPSSAPYLAVAMDHHVHKEYEIVGAGNAPWVQSFMHEEQMKFHPNVTWARADDRGPLLMKKPTDKPALYVCESGTCREPALSLEAARQSLVGKSN